VAGVTTQEVDNLRRLLAFATEEVVPNIRTDDDPYDIAILVGLFARVTTTTQALVLLIENGFAEHAMMLNRVTFELMVDVYWVADNHDLAGKRFVQHARFHHHLKRKLAPRYPDLLDNVPAETGDELEPEELAELEDLYSRYGSGSWTGLNLYHRVEAIVDDFDESDARHLRAFRDIVHRLDNEELHPTSRSIARSLRRRPTSDGGEVLQFALRSAWWIYLQSLHVVITALDLPLEERLGSLSAHAAWPNQS
jgi:hypothetical protein